MGGREIGQGKGPWVAVGGVTWSKEGAELSRGAEGLRRRLLQETELERLTAAWKDFVPPGFGDLAELGSTLQRLALPEERLPYVRVCLAHPLKLKLGLQRAPLGVCGDSRCFWPGLEQCPVDMAELPTHGDTGEIPPWRGRARSTIGQQAQREQVPLESEQVCLECICRCAPSYGLVKLSGDACASSALEVNPLKLVSVFQALLDSAQLRDPLRHGAERLAAERGARHHPGGRGPGCAGPRAGCGTAGPGPSPVDPRNRSPAIIQVLGMGLCPAWSLGAGCLSQFGLRFWQD